MVESNSGIGAFVIAQGDSRELMPLFQDGCVESVITDPPYLGFGFTPANYLQFMRPFTEQMLRCAGAQGRLAISQPEQRVGEFSRNLGASKKLRIDDAFADSRGEPAWFILRNPKEGVNLRSESWYSIPDTSHPNPRNVNKMASLIRLMSDPGETILDPFCGSGAIGLAAVLLGRNYVGIELGQERADDARRRFIEINASELDIAAFRG